MAYFKIMRLISFFLLFLYAYAPFSGFAQEGPAPKFRLPVDCTYGQDCWVMNYTDNGAPNDGKAVDPGCLSRTYEDHKGTDINIPDEQAMKNGVAVLAAQSGKVTRARDGEPDQRSSAAQLQKIRESNKDCGNAVLIDHGGGWQTMYCHMKKDSIKVKAGQNVKAGDKIGEVGLSGYTSFPHLHFGIMHHAEIIDPFSGASIEKSCGESSASLWDNSTKLSYEPLAITRDGFDSKKPSLALLDRGEKQKTELYAVQSPALVYYAVYQGALEGDKIDLKIYDPNGKIFAEHSVVQDKTRARQMHLVGRKTDQILLRKGTYKGAVLITRAASDGTKQSWSKEASIEVK